MDVRLDGEAALVVASQHVERNPGDEVVLRIQANILGALTLALVRHPAVERVFGPGLGAINRDMQLEIHGEGKANDVEARTNVGAGAGRLDHEGLHFDASYSPVVLARCSLLRFGGGGAPVEAAEQEGVCGASLRLSRQVNVELARLAKMCCPVEICRVEKNVCWLAGASSHAL
jgi:hypothetical protein